MEVVEQVVASTLPAEQAAPVQEGGQTKQQTPSQPPGSLTKIPRNRPKHELASSGDGDWNKFARECATRKAQVQISTYSKEEAIRRRQWEKERREAHERNARLVLQRSKEEAAQHQQEKEERIAERKAWAKAKFEQRQEKINRAAEERQKRELAYDQLLEKTREKGLLFERLQQHGEELVAAEERAKLEGYKTVLAPTRKIGARDIRHADDLHPSLRALQRAQQQDNMRREASKMPLAFNPKHVNKGPGGTSPFSSGIGERIMPGTGCTRPDSIRDSSEPRRPVTKLRRPSPVRTQGPSIDRASSPVALPGVEIIVHQMAKAPKSDAQRQSCAARPSVHAHAPQQHVVLAQQSIPSIPDTASETATEVPDAVAVQTPEPVQAAESKLPKNTSTTPPEGPADTQGSEEGKEREES